MIEGNFDEHRRRLVLTYSGFWTETVARAMQGRFHHFVREAGNHGPFTLLEDLRQFSVQAAAVLDLNATLFVVTPDMKILRNAMLVSSALLRMQNKRAFPDNELVRTFDSVRAADEWLAEMEPGV